MTNTEGFIVVFLFLAVAAVCLTLGKAIERANEDLKKLRGIKPPTE